MNANMNENKLKLPRNPERIEQIINFSDDFIASAQFI